MTYEEAVRELFKWQYRRNPKPFLKKLFELALEANSLEGARLMRGFPTEMAAFQSWLKENPKKFFERHGLKLEIENEQKASELTDLDFDGERGLLSNSKQSIIS